MKLANHTRKWIDKQGISCIGFVVQFLREAGFDVPDGAGYVGPRQAGFVSVDTFLPEWRENPLLTEQNMVRAIMPLTEPSSIRFPKLYDFLVISQRLGRHILFPAVYVGGGKAMAAFVNDGVMAFRLDKNNRCVVARRFPRCQA